MSQPVRHHKTLYQQQKLQQHLERMVEERRIEELKATLLRKMEAKSQAAEKDQAA
ncbi:MAG TPA: hypothetical protein VGF06_12830 [Terriglobales bacterium]